MKRANYLVLTVCLLSALTVMTGCTLDADVWADVTTLAGTPGEFGNADGAAGAARFTRPELIAIGSDNHLYVADYFRDPDRNDWEVGRIRRVDARIGLVSTLTNSADGSSNERGIPGINGGIRGMVVGKVSGDPTEYIFISDHHNHQIKRYSLNTTNYQITLLDTYGSGAGAYRDGPKDMAAFNYPSGLALNSETGVLYIADSQNNRIRTIHVATGEVSTLAGSGEEGYAEGTRTAAQFSQLVGVALGRNGNLIVNDTWNHCIRMVTPDGQTSMYASYRGSWGFRDGEGFIAQVGIPQYVTTDSSGNAYFTDSVIPAIRKITPGRIVQAPFTPGNPNGQWMPDKIAGRMVFTIAGYAGWSDRNSGYPGHSFRDGNNVEARFNNPRGIVVADNGTIYVADTDNHVIRMIRK